MLTQTQQIQQSEFGTNTNLPFNNFTQTSRSIKNNMGVNTIPPLHNTTQTLPSQNRSRGINTNIGDNSFTQTMQPEHTIMGTNTSNNATSQECECVDQETEQPSIQYHSEFARSLQNYQDPVQAMQTDEPQQQSIPYATPPALKYNPVHLMQTDEPIEKQSIPYSERPALKYNPSSEVQSYQTGPPARQQAVPHTIPFQSTQHLPIENSQPLALEWKINCNLCETPTQFNDMRKLDRHVERFHGDFKQTKKGTKRRQEDKGNKKMKKIRWE